MLTGGAREAFVRAWAKLLPDTLSMGARTSANTLAEQMAMNAARAGAGASAGMQAMNDPRLQVGNWEKMQYLVQGAANQVVANVHYVRETLTGIVKDFKFK
jgi:hypothetical protein